MSRREKRDWRFVRLEKTSFPKTESPLDSKLLKKKKRRKTVTFIEKKEQNKNETNHKQCSQNKALFKSKPINKT